MPYRTLDEKVLWKQLDGPQANSLIEGARRWMKSWSIPILKYFEKFSIDTASGVHLDFIGNIMGVNRPIVMADYYFDQTFKFWELPTDPNQATGFSTSPTTSKDPNDLTPVTDGGLFDYLHNTDRPLSTLVDMTDDEYRFVLRKLADSEGELGSYIFLDDICYSFAGQYYQLSSALGVFGEARAEDVYIYLSRYNPRAYLAIEAIMRAYVTPFPRVFINMAPGG
jgi:hypothetical protein